MNHTFNLITQPWIPVLDMQGNYLEVGLAQALAEADSFQSVAAPTALETAAIQRLLLAIVHRNHKTSSKMEWAAVWQSGRFNQSVLANYWQKWSDRFDLFNPDRPFYQQPTNRKKPVSAAGFFPGLAAADHFNHSVQLAQQDLSPAEAARNLLVAQTFGLSGGCIPAERLSHKAASWVAGMVFFVEGDTLFQTLMYNLLRYNQEHPTTDLSFTEDDRPNWEADGPYQPRNQPYGYLDYMTWPSRMIWLKPETQDGHTVVRSYVDFVGLPPPVVLDPFKFYRKDKNSKNATGYIPLYLNPNKAVWRSSSAIMRLHRDGFRTPASLNWLADLRHIGALSFPLARLVGYGLVVENQTKVILLRRESIPLPLAYLEQSADPEAQADLLFILDMAIKQAEQIGKALSSAIFRLAEIIYPRSRSEDKATKLTPDQRQQVNRIVHTITTVSEYWALLEQPFYQLVVDLPSAEKIQKVQERWLKTAVKTGRDCLAASERRAGQFPAAWKGGVLARNLFEWILRKDGLAEPLPEGEKSAENTL
ncbi:MAG: type I-E CRISPR-associated protein Cse1/CasA [Chloroflexi bacterium GWB2_54_36]|nr:MAG: type I-E CRISPR-associated protein Cse1/CasA [Chloroflexi bacterium GWB2_54_36]